MSESTNEVLLQRVVFPEGRSQDAVPVYLGVVTRDNQDTYDLIESRHSIKIPNNRVLSFCSYFNAFPASYWKYNTIVDHVTLKIELEGSAKVMIYRSFEDGSHEIVRTIQDQSTISEMLNLDESFEDGGWYWFEVDAQESEGEVTLKSAAWVTHFETMPEFGKANISITTLNKSEYIMRHFDTYAKNPELFNFIDKIYVVDQGSKKVRGNPDFAEKIAPIKDKVEIIEQANLGGSGGFSRGMYEAAYHTNAKYALLLDDDTTPEPESFIRAVTFSNLTRKEILVGGHMFWNDDLPVMQAVAERLYTDTFRWRAVEGTPTGYTFAFLNLKQTKFMHKRYESNYNGWWFCLIPTNVIRQIGLSLPQFIKLDDVEFGLRASMAGYATVSFPTTFVWHNSFGRKDDTIDWQGYYHERNRMIVALLYSSDTYPVRFTIGSLLGCLARLAEYRYSVCQMKVDALENVLAGPKVYENDLPGRLPKIQKMRSQYSDSVVKPVEEFPPAKNKKWSYVMGGKGKIIALVTGMLRQFKPVPENAAKNPKYFLMPETSRMSQMLKILNTDSDVFCYNDGDTGSLLVRDREKTFYYAKKLFKLNIRLMLKWAKLKRAYRSQKKHLTSKEMWEGFFFDC